MWTTNVKGRSVFHRRAPRHGAPPASRWRPFAHILRRAAAPVDPGAAFTVEEELVRPLSAGSLRQRPGGVFEDILLGPADRPTALFRFRPRDVVWTTEAAEGIAAGMRGRVVRVASFRPSRRIGVRMDAEGWAPLVWFDEDEIRTPVEYGVLGVADTLAMDAVPVMGGAR